MRHLAFGHYGPVVVPLKFVKTIVDRANCKGTTVKSRLSAPQPERNRHWPVMAKC
jgi:hypothetical protein